MTDINRRLQYNSTSQKQAKQAAEYLELDRQGKEIEERGQVRMILPYPSLNQRTFLPCLLYNPLTNAAPSLPYKESLDLARQGKIGIKERWLAG